MKNIKCLRKSMRLMEIGLRKATSYKMVKGRLNYRWYNDDFLQARIRTTRKEIQSFLNE
jgi:hypothetical protein